MKPNPPPSPFQRKLEVVQIKLRSMGIDDAEVRAVDDGMINFTAPGFNPSMMRREDFDARDETTIANIMASKMREDPSI